MFTTDALLTQASLLSIYVFVLKQVNNRQNVLAYVNLSKMKGFLFNKPKDYKHRQYIMNEVSYFFYRIY